MATRLSLHSQLSSIMETMAKTALSQVCKLVDEESSELRLECSRLLFANSALTEKVNNLQCELTIVKTNASKSYRTVGVQTVCSNKGGDNYESAQPTIERIFSKDWCIDLWKDRDPCMMEKESDSTDDEKTAAVSNQSTDFKEEEYTDESISCQPDTCEAPVDLKEHAAEETEQQSKDCTLADGSADHQTVGQEAKSATPTSCPDEVPMQTGRSKGKDEAFSTYTIPIEDDEEEDDNDDDDDDVQFVDESQEGPSQDEQQSNPTSTDNIHDLDDYSLDTFDDFDIVGTVIDSNQDRFTCHICNRSFFHKGTLTNHMKSHRSNYCNICKQNFPHKQLDTHICVPPVASHRISKSCEICGKVFANPSALRIHYVVHTGEKPYRCSICGKGFTQKGNLKCHLRIHTGERPFQCVWCGKTFTQKVNLNHHLISHRNDSVQESPNEDMHLET